MPKKSDSVQLWSNAAFKFKMIDEDFKSANSLQNFMPTTTLAYKFAPTELLSHSDIFFQQQVM